MASYNLNVARVAISCTTEADEFHNNTSVAAVKLRVPVFPSPNIMVQSNCTDSIGTCLICSIAGLLFVMTASFGNRTCLLWHHQLLCQVEL